MSRDFDGEIQRANLIGQYSKAASLKIEKKQYELSKLQRALNACKWCGKQIDVNIHFKRDGYCSEKCFHDSTNIALKEQSTVTDKFKALELEWNSRECPQCAETIKKKAKICRYCKFELTDRDEIVAEMKEAETLAARFSCKPWEEKVQNRLKEAKKEREKKKEEEERWNSLSKEEQEAEIKEKKRIEEQKHLAVIEEQEKEKRRKQEALKQRYLEIDKIRERDERNRKREASIQKNKEENQSILIKFGLSVISIFLILFFFASC